MHINNSNLEHKNFVQLKITNLFTNSDFSFGHKKYTVLGNNEYVHILCKKWAKFESIQYALFCMCNKCR